MNETQDTSKARVLVVDDERANRKLLADLVAREGYEAVVAADGAEALAMLERELVDLVLLDLMMPGVDGMAVLAELQKQQKLPALPVVVITAHEDRKVRIDALTAGAIDFLTKPIDRVEVACKVRTLIELKRLRERAVETALAGLPLVAYELEVGDIDSMAGSWVIGNIERLNGITSDEFFDSQDWMPRVHPDDRPQTEDALRLALDGTKPELMLDIDDQVAVEQQLRQAQKMDAVGQLAGGVAHDFNNIIKVILSYGSFIRDSLPAGDERREDIIEVLKAGDRAAALTRQLLAFSRQQPTEKRPVDLNRSLAQIHKLLVRTLGEHVALTTVPSARPAVVRIDPVQFDQIALNLAVNGRDAMPDGGQRLRPGRAREPRRATGSRHLDLRVCRPGCRTKPSGGSAHPLDGPSHRETWCGPSRRRWEQAGRQFKPPFRFERLGHLGPKTPSSSGSESLPFQAGKLTVGPHKPG